MKKPFKALSGITAMLVLFIYIAVIYGTCSIPDEISRSDAEVNAAGFIFSAESPAAEDADASGGEISISVPGVIPVKNVKVSTKALPYHIRKGHSGHLFFNHFVEYLLQIFYSN